MPGLFQWWSKIPRPGSPARLILLVTVLGLALRIVFMTWFTGIGITQDAGIYLDTAGHLHDFICERVFQTCPPGTFTYQAELSLVFRAFEDYGLHTLLLVVPYSLSGGNDNAARYLVLLLYDTFLYAMVIQTVRRLKFPLWVAVLAGALHAVYIPAIVLSGTMLQVPLIQFLVVAVVWSYTQVFTATQRREQRSYTVAGTLTIVMLGFSSLALRPLIPVLFLLVLAYGAMAPERRAFFRFQAALVGLVIIAAFIAALWFNSIGIPQHPLALTSRLLTGLPSDDTRLGAYSTVLSYEHFWPASGWENRASYGSFFQDFVRSPGEFSYWFLYGVFNNYRYPGNIYLQEFILSLPAQQAYHVVYLLTGLTGLAWLAGHRQQRGWSGRLILSIGLVFTLVYSLINIETRRLVPLSPFFAIGTAVFIYSLKQLWQRRRLRWPDAGVVIAFLVIQAVPLALLLWVMPLEPDGAHFLQVAAATGLLLICLVRLIQHWFSLGEGWQWPAPAIFLTGIILLFGLVQFQESDWRVWSMPLENRVQQRVEGYSRQTPLFPWIVMDVQPEYLSDSLVISVNDEVIKPAGVPLYRWEAGGIWRPYQTMLRLANYPAERRLWMAYPLPEKFWDEHNLTIILELTGWQYMMLAADYLAPGTTTYEGPLLDAWYTGHSYWRWQWNASDPRIPASQPLLWHYQSQYDSGTAWRSDDLSPAPGRQRGLYRIFIVHEVFSTPTNALDPDLTGATRPCDEVPLALDVPSVCYTADYGMQFYDRAGVLAGSTPAEKFVAPSARNSLIDRIDYAGGHIEVWQVMLNTPWFVANFYTPNNHLTYSLAFLRPVLTAVPDNEKVNP